MGQAGRVTEERPPDKRVRYQLSDEIGAVILRMIDYADDIFGGAVGLQAEQEYLTAAEERNIRSAEVHVHQAARLLGL